MITLDQARQLQGNKLLGAGNTELGTISELYADRADGSPTFATVHTGLFGMKTHFVPLSDATVDGNALCVPYDKDLVKDAPSIEPDAELSPQEEDRLYQHYGLSGTTAPQADTGKSTDDAMTRSEEQLKVGTQQVETGRARLRKIVTTDTETVTVPVTKEEVVLEREPITDANRDQALSGPDISEAEHEVVLTEERPVVAKETVPVERVRVGKTAVQDEVTVTEDVRKEQIEADGVYPDDATTPDRAKAKADRR